jgi:glycosyltransferase involved in cell wall biosynthesis
MTKISVLIPAFNEEATIIELLEKVRAQEIEEVAFEIVVVDDGSTDRTAELVQSRPDLYDHFVKLSKNLGKGGAVKSGLAAVTGDYVLFQDADLEYDPNEYAALFKPVLRFHADIVLGSRIIAPAYTRVHYFWHKVGNWLITFVFNLFNNTTFTDIYSCYLMYRRDLLEPTQLVSNGWAQQAEILSRIVPKAEVIYEVPISYHGRSYAEGKKIRGSDAVSVVWTIFMRRLFR